VAYVGATLVRVEPIRVARFELRLPPPRIALAQLVVSIVDWTLAGAVLYVLLPAGAVSFTAFLTAFLAAQLLGLVSHVPGGVGVFEGLMVLLLKPFLSSGTLLPALIVYRAVYYLLPLTVALAVLIADEVHQRRTQAARLGAVIGRLNGQITPSLLAAFTFLAGVVLLLSGATPAASGRLALLDRLLPLGVIEVSHFAGSVVGVALLVLSQGLARRLDAAYVLSVIAIVIGIVTSLLKGADYEEAALLALVLVAILRARPAFDRRATLFDTRFSVGWIVGDDGSPRRVDLARPLLVQARRVHQRAVVAVRAERRVVAHAAGLRGRVDGAPALRHLAADPPRAARGARADRRGARRGRNRDRGTDGHLPVPRLPARQGAALRRRPHGIRDVRGRRAHLGGAGRSRRAARASERPDPAVPRAL
jgi:hypothetical protein